MMKILWITNTIFPSPSKALGFLAPVVGGWMYGLAEQLAAQSNVHLAVATTYAGKEMKTCTIDGIQYYLLPVKSRTTYQKELEPHWKSLCEEFSPDLVHIHGTEFSHGLACMRACPDLNYVVSIQGLVSAITHYYCAGINFTDIAKNTTFRDIIRRDAIFQGRKKFQQRGVFEVECLWRTKHIIGRTHWDHAHAKAVNPRVHYHFCNESLRDGFYTASKWDIHHKADYAIFLSQAGYPIKGAHQVIRAAAMLKKEFPNIQIRVAGHDITQNATLSQKLRLSGYGKYLRTLIHRGSLQDNVRFLGPLDEARMIAEYKNAHVFICPSSIENSPNSLGEAQMLGTPSIAAYVGGVPDMVTDGVSGLLYRFEEVEMLAEHIRKIFTDDALAMRLSSGGIAAAEKRHERKTNLEQLMSIYNKVVS